METTFDVQALLEIVNALHQCEALVRLEEQPDPITSVNDVKQHHLTRQVIEDHLQSVLKYVHSTRDRIGRFPKLPYLSLIKWAQAMLALPNLAFLEVDTDGLGEDASVLRVLLLTAQGEVTFDTLIRPKTPLSASLQSITGITQAQLVDAPPLSAVWPRIVEALTGKYILSYNLAFDQSRLRHNGARVEGELPHLVAECLMLQATAYFHLTTHAKLADLCSTIWHPLPDAPNQTALHRATGQLRLLEAMANGFTQLPHSFVPFDEPDFDDEHPF